MQKQMSLYIEQEGGEEEEIDKKLRPEMDDFLFAEVLKKTKLMRTMMNIHNLDVCS
jgi:hypothetical protein